MIRRIAACVFIAFLLFGATLSAATLTVPDNLVPLGSEHGEQLLLQSQGLQAYVPLSINFLTQKNQAFCGVASIVIVLNALDIAAPTSPEYEPYRTFTQENFLDERTEAVLPREVMMKKGMTLDELGRLLALHSVRAEVRHAADSTLAGFRLAAREYLGGTDRAVIVNYLRKAIGEERGGHISPLAAYDVDSDRFLILDVARYKYPPVWVKSNELFAAMNTTDSDNQNQTRGYVLIQKGDSIQAAPGGTDPTH